MRTIVATMRCGILLSLPMKTKMRHAYDSLSDLPVKKTFTSKIFDILFCLPMNENARNKRLDILFYLPVVFRLV